MMEYQDKVLVCKDCGKEFTFTAGEQAFYAEKGFAHEPVRCHECRDNKRRQHEEQVHEMYDVTCSKCGKPTKVPFEPKADRPVYCRDCLNLMRSKK